ncbi:MAG: tol-pal system protein YbgF, partial [Thermodesulfobacteriota bacterium]
GYSRFAALGKSRNRAHFSPVEGEEAMGLTGRIRRCCRNRNRVGEGERSSGIRCGSFLIFLALSGPIWFSGCAVSQADGASSRGNGSETESGVVATPTGETPRYREVSESFHRSLFHILNDSRAVAARETARHVTPAAPAKPSRGMGRAGHTANPDRMYRKARAFYEGGDFERARAGFEAFVERFPDHSLSDNARYWIGESYYAQEQYREAGVHFRRVLVEHPNGNKVPDAFFKLGLCFHRRGDAEAARTHWEQLVQRYPRSRAAGLARRRLSE